MRVPWTARRSNQSILKEISPEYSLEGLMLKLKVQYFGHLMRRTDLFEKTLMLGKIEDGRRTLREEWESASGGARFLSPAPAIVVVQPLNRVRLSATRGLQNTRLPVHRQLPELAQTHVCCVGDAIQPSHPVLFPSPTFNLSQHQGLFQ